MHILDMKGTLGYELSVKPIVFAHNNYKTLYESTFIFTSRLKRRPIIMNKAKPNNAKVEGEDTIPNILPSDKRTI